MPGCPFVWLPYEHVLFAPQIPVLHVCAGQVPQFTICPQLLVTLPHLPEQVFAAGVQQAPLALHTWPLAQQVPLQQSRPPVQLLPGWPFV